MSNESTGEARVSFRVIPRIEGKIPIPPATDIKSSPEVKRLAAQVDRVIHGLAEWCEAKSGATRVPGLRIEKPDEDVWEVYRTVGKVRTRVHVDTSTSGGYLVVDKKDFDLLPQPISSIQELLKGPLVFDDPHNKTYDSVRVQWNFGKMRWTHSQGKWDYDDRAVKISPESYEFDPNKVLDFVMRTAFMVTADSDLVSSWVRAGSDVEKVKV
ncbi:hypothetical protein A2368_02940 [Candidatus Collierbacteria bacterium RIFOXYB1_FULL_49_13]|uniref:Uncharacterized protein n=1 Tax=Candidatus Collierbacteria bacterium RIFOXYB1_FULL_49_13 TaxID=1817728 RepID=A0A1F5FKI2_9BACT|nr:MAG: hypothetical protein A2368_02940 [Candidatus Collierbacteria bacterium RIFOXYB1_FULL_49_13]